MIDYPNAYNQFKNEITLPLHTLLTNEEVQYIIETFKGLLPNVSKKTFTIYHKELQCEEVRPYFEILNQRRTSLLL